jgi:hypothetical protein
MLYGRSPFLHDNPNMMFGKILEDEPTFPKEFKYSDESTDLIKKLLRKNGNERIGVDDEQEIFTHPWFNEIDFGKLNQKKLPALIIPHIDEDGPYSHYIAPGESTEDSQPAPLELSFEKDDKKPTSHCPIVAPAMFPQRKTPDASFEDFSYFEEEDNVETPMLEDMNILDEDWENERRVQLLTNIEEGSDEEENERDALDSPRGEEESDRLEISPRAASNNQVEERSFRKMGSMEELRVCPDKGSDEKLDHRTMDLCDIPYLREHFKEDPKGPAVKRSLGSGLLASSRAVSGPCPVKPIDDELPLALRIQEAKY